MDTINNVVVLVGIAVVIFMVSIALLIFAPKRINFYDTSLFTGVVKVCLNSYANLDIQNIKAVTQSDTGWVDWPDKKNIKGNIYTYPIYMFSTLSECRKNKCNDIYNTFRMFNNIKTLTIVKISDSSEFLQHSGWANLTNKTMRCVVVLESPGTSVDECGIWINGETKRLNDSDVLIYDASQQHAIWNKADDDLYLLYIDFTRPESIPFGISTRKYTDETHDFVHNLIKHKNDKPKNI
jgi:hypothetical protein